MTRRSLGLAAVTFALAAPASAAVAAGPAPVSVRVEGDTATLVPRTTLTTTTTPVVKDGNPAHSCTGTSAAGALEQATARDWAGTWSSSFQYSVDAIRGERHTFGSGRFWAIYVNDVAASTGVCGIELQAGDQLLFASAPEDGSGGAVLALQGVPAVAAPGMAFTVKVVRTVSSFDSSGNATGSSSPVAGATVSGAGALATTGADGTAQVTFATRGPAGLRATHAPDIRSATEPVCVTDGADGACGTTAAAVAAPSTCATTGDDGNCGTVDRRPPLGKITSIRERQRFAKGRGPRLLAGIVTPDPSGIGGVRLRLTRSDHGRCSTFDGRRERFVALRRCGATRGRWFDAGDREQWSFLLPRRLGRGRYVLDLQARDRKGNRDTLLQRTRTRVVFTVA